MARLSATLLAGLVLFASLTATGRAQEPTPWPGAAECTVEPYDLTTVLTPTDATPPVAAEPTPAERPTGEPADDETIQAVTETIGQFIGCSNLGYPFRVLFLLTPEYLPVFVAENAGPITAADIAQLNALANATEPFDPLPPDQQTVIVAIEDVEVLEDGRVIATVIGDNLAEPDGPNAVYFIFRELNGRYLIDGIIAPSNDGTPES
jgi:hypothetical protein